MILSAAACATVMRPGDQYQDAAKDFAKRLRWADCPGAALHMSAAVRDDFMTRFGGNDDLRVVEFSPEQVEFGEDDKTADAWYSLEYYLLPSASVKKKRIKLHWEYQEESRLRPGVWRITSEFPPLP